jgi:D-glycero-alpha-D-manno-heptose-7-phosphate kinase
MVITRCPLRVSLVGGGTDLPIYGDDFVGNTTTIAINKYVYIISHRNFNTKGIKIRYSKIETVNSAAQIKHNIFRQVLGDYNMSNIEISSVADIRSGSGLGSSSAFTNALIAACRIIKNQSINPISIAYESSDIEINRLGYKIGLQDHFSTALGSIQNLSFKSGIVTSNKLDISEEIVKELTDSILLIDTGSRNPSETKRKQRTIETLSQTNLSDLKRLSDLSLQVTSNIKSGNLDLIAEAIEKSWTIKQLTHVDLFTPKVKKTLNEIVKTGAKSFKLLGSGKGGFFLIYEQNPKIRETIWQYFGPRVLAINVDNSGLKNLEASIHDK